MEDYVNKIPEVDLVMNSVGGNGAMSMGGSSTNTASLVVMLKPLSERDRSDKEIAHELQQQVSQIPGAEITAEAYDMMSMSSGGAISIEIKGNNNDDMELLASSIEDIMYSVSGTTNIENSIEDTDEELDIIIDRDKAAYYSVSASSVYQTVALALNGSTVSKYRGRGRRIGYRFEISKRNFDLSG